MARHDPHHPFGSAAVPGRSFDAQIEASLRRQFVVPNAILPTEGACATADAWSAPGSEWRIGFPSHVSLRQAAGLILAASLWAGSGYLFFTHVGSPSASASRRSSPPFEILLDAATPLGRLVQQYETLKVEAAGSDSADSPSTASSTALSTISLQDEMWQRLRTGLDKRTGEATASRLNRLRQGDKQVELLAVDETDPASDDGPLFVAARVEGTLIAALIEQTETSRSQRYASAPQPSLSEGPESANPAPQLHTSRFGVGFGYELTVADQAILVPALLPEARPESSLDLRHWRVRHGGSLPVAYHFDAE